MNDAPPDLHGLSVAILAVDGFEQVEMTEPRKALEAAGARTTLVSMNPGQVRGFHHDKPADTFEVQLTLEKADPQAFDAVLLPGGVMNADHLRLSHSAQRFVQGMQRGRKPFAFICHAPWLLVSAGLVKGRTLTSWPSLQDDVRNAGATWVDREVVHDGNWVSSRKPADIPVFNAAMLDLFAKQRVATAH
ncbi:MULTISPECIES: type 1 glutamine amidotransferase domain-containing protein [Ramlibacter]|uniref:DJ-1/PfpI/YhbO family deglycase/protease n=1 Tax=Ramlibacter pinisoli TaxID=2682844 RepID=A0A6N8IVE3_9BURK|nr:MULTISPECIES: type 1 glutamine amidotransferase domain-containing protein [Ramlibacter]MBA2960968.1 type 1 glutamine amidotransferase [Ramlibacter sp. CGMCC 1.13660]MVQ30914.1 DJ-1/PfpI/YhbO family deglycase/protease [Ramlibacter pinisoli]